MVGFCADDAEKKVEAKAFERRKKKTKIKRQRLVCNEHKIYVAEIILQPESIGEFREEERGRERRRSNTLQKTMRYRTLAVR